MSKINHALSDWNTGDVHGRDWFERRDINQRLAYSYFESGYLRKLGPGVFTKKNDKVNPYALIKFLQSEYKLRLHVSGRSSLELQGLGHYVPLGKNKRIYLTSYVDRSFPTWLKKDEIPFDLIFKKSSLLEAEKYLNSVEVEGFEIIISSRELAILELIEQLDLSSSLETLENYLESLNTLRVDIVQMLLEECRSIKVKRVFLYLSEKLELKFYKSLDFKNIDLGSGKRVVVKGGQLNKKYQITVDQEVEVCPF